MEVVNSGYFDHSGENFEVKTEGTQGNCLPFLLVLLLTAVQANESNAATLSGAEVVIERENWERSSEVLAVVGSGGYYRESAA